ncbi:GNAT family N-acetyltransferase [Streptococcus parasanguinis]|uniref:GNAT family N-acetyltransferase n=1 Tax=Streptococcus parasanguinis TaxID=1318 RepID=UPI00066EB19B|nr:GNAT family N-acetyltransferase [Streptococcus parasanguinis]
MMIRQITPADQEQLLLLEEELHDNECFDYSTTLEEILDSNLAFSILAEQDGDIAAYLLATEDQHLMDDLIVLRLAVKPAFQAQGYGSILIATLKDLAVQIEKKAIWVDCPEDLLSYFAQQEFRDEAESDRGVRMVWKR